MLIIAFVGLGISIDSYFDQQALSRDSTSDIELHKGTFFLLNKELKRLPEEERQSYLTIISASFGYPITLLNISSLSLTEEQKSYLEQGGILSNYDEQEGKAWFSQRLDQTNKAITIGPIIMDTSATSDLMLNLFFFVGLALITFIWAWPLSRGLGKLTKVATEFGQGNFEVRASTNTSSPLIMLVRRFNSMAARIQRLIKSHQELSHAVSHELRTPIARIRFAMAMVREVDDAEQQAKYLKVMDDNIEELDGLVDELLTYARFDREEPDLEFLELDIVATINHVIEKFTLTHQHLEIQCINSNSEVIQCYFDQDAIERALDNLVRNACRYAKLKIQISIEQKDEQIFLFIDDDGPGVPKEERQQLFEPFVRLDQSRDRNSGGIGLGLAMVKRLIELHHGHAAIAEADLGGARFILSWPVKAS